MNKITIIKTVTMTLVTFLIYNAQAQDNQVCPTTEQCVLGGAGVAAGAAGGGVSYGKFLEARKITADNMVSILKTTTNVRDLTPAKVNGIANPLTDGDRVLIEFEYTEAESRQIIAKRLESSADDARRNGDRYLDKAAEALRRQRDITNSKGEVIDRVSDPDEFGAAHYRSLSRDAYEEQRSLEQKAWRVRSGIESIDLVRDQYDIDSSHGTKASAKGFLEERIAKGGRIFSVNRVPAQYASLARKARTVGGVVAGAAAVITTLGVAETVTGVASEQMRRIRNGSGSTYFNGGIR